jgi:hypothetical protein
MAKKAKMKHQSAMETYWARHDELGQRKIKLGREIQEKWEKDTKTAPEKTSEKKDQKGKAELEYKKATDEMET